MTILLPPTASRASPSVFPPGTRGTRSSPAAPRGTGAGAIVGSHGSGKTTLLEQLAPRLNERGFTPQFFRINAASMLIEKDAVLARVRTLRAPDFLLLDGAEQFTTRQWLSLHSSASTLAGCLITVHRTSRLPTLLETQTSPALLAELAAELTGERLTDTDAAARFKRHAGNLRECLRELYDQQALV